MVGDKDLHPCVLSDSVNILRKTESGWSPKLESQRRPKLTKICVIFVPGHMGVKDNKRAGRLASMAAMVNECTVD